MSLIEQNNDNKRLFESLRQGIAGRRCWNISEVESSGEISLKTRKESYCNEMHRSGSFPAAGIVIVLSLFFISTLQLPFFWGLFFAHCLLFVKRCIWTLVLFLVILKEKESVPAKDLYHKGSSISGYREKTGMTIRS